MADSDITVNNLTAAGGVGQITLSWSPAVDSHTPGGLPSLQLATVEVWGASSNNLAAASLIGESAGTRLVEANLARAQQRYYWIRPRTKAGLFGAWHPSSDVAGVSGQELNNSFSLTTNGYYLLPNGLLLQWGAIGMHGSVDGSWNNDFSAVFFFDATCSQDSSAYPTILNVQSFSTSGFSLAAYYYNTSLPTITPIPASVTASWFALGLP